MHYKKLFFSMDSVEVKVQLATFAINAIQKRKWPCRLPDRVFGNYLAIVVFIFFLLKNDSSSAFAY